jgi:AhpD family alkylhydroperoxidase
MSRIAIPARDDVPAESQEMLNAIAKQLRFVPNLYRTASISPNALTGLINFRTAISGALDMQTLTRIALVVSQVNECQYCLSLHTYLGMNYGGLSPTEMALNRQGTSANSLRLCRRLCGWEARWRTRICNPCGMAAITTRRSSRS